MSTSAVRFPRSTQIPTRVILNPSTLSVLPSGGLQLILEGDALDQILAERMSQMRVELTPPIPVGFDPKLLTSQLWGVAAKLYKFEQGTLDQKGAVSKRDKEAVLARHPHLVEACSETSRFPLRDKRRTTAISVKNSPFTLAAYLTWLHYPHVVGPFLDAFCRGRNLREGNPTLALRRYIMRSRQGMSRGDCLDIVCAASKAIEATIRGEKITDLTFAPGEIFTHFAGHPYGQRVIGASPLLKH